MRGVRVGRRTKIQTLRLSTDILERASAKDVGQLVATRLSLDAERASVSDVLREAVTLGLGVLEDQASAPGRVVRRPMEVPSSELEAFEREVMPVIREQIAASWGRIKKRKR